MIIELNSKNISIKCTHRPIDPKELKRVAIYRPLHSKVYHIAKYLTEINPNVSIALVSYPKIDPQIRNIKLTFIGTQK